MKPQPHTLLLHPFFILGLGLLLCNDLCLKYEFHNWFTGKLSDFAGLFVFAVFLLTFFPSHRKKVIGFCILFFCWWKSPLSSFLFDLANHSLNIPLHRTIDYTDLSAFSVLPLANRIQAPVYRSSLPGSIAVYMAGTLSFFSFCSTSVYRHAQGQEIVMDKAFRTKLEEEEIINKFNEKGIAIEKDTAYYKKLDGYNKYLKIKDSSGGQKTIRIDDYKKEIELYERSTPNSPTYTIPLLAINNDTLKQVRFSIEEMYNGKKRIILLKSFLYDSTLGAKYVPYPFKGERKIEKPIKEKIQEILK